MGNILKRGTQRFNAENRARRLIAKEQIRPAPKHPSTATVIKQFQQRNPDILEQQQRKDERLLKLLENIRVDSRDVKHAQYSDGDQTFDVQRPRALPSSRKPNPIPTSLFDIPDEVPSGRLSVPMAIEMLAKHKRNPDEWSAERLASEYQLNLTDAQNVLEYFQSFKVITVQDDNTPPKKRLLGR